MLTWSIYDLRVVRMVKVNTCQRSGVEDTLSVVRNRFRPVQRLSVVRNRPVPVRSITPRGIVGEGRALGGTAIIFVFGNWRALVVIPFTTTATRAHPDEARALLFRLLWGAAQTEPREPRSTTVTSRDIGFDAQVPLCSQSLPFIFTEMYQTLPHVLEAFTRSMHNGLHERSSEAREHLVSAEAHVINTHADGTINTKEHSSHAFGNWFRTIVSIGSHLSCAIVQTLCNVA
mmetsp:Transcript_60538/g.160936  ORF Transcript_60538/g.160936 Transcript_60538/m.160936 type:complete len:231 (+) Transcript_60538:700-1392(+)